MAEDLLEYIELGQYVPKVIQELQIWSRTASTYVDLIVLVYTKYGVLTVPNTIME